MEKWILKTVLILLIINALFTSTISAAQDPNAECAIEKYNSPSSATISKSGMNQFRDWFHNPTPWLSMEADLRWEWFYARNIDTLRKDPIGRNSTWNFTLNRFRWGTKTKITDDIEFNQRLVWEFRTYDNPSIRDKNVDLDEITWDRFNITVRNLGNMPLTMVAGRQDIIFGTGWLILDGTPADEGRTIYFDALRFTYEIPDRDTTVDMIYIDQRAHSDDWLKPINDNHNHINAEDTSGAILYVTDKSRPNLQLEGYFIYKHSFPVTAGGNKAGIYFRRRFVRVDRGKQTLEIQGRGRCADRPEKWTRPARLWNCK